MTDIRKGDVFPATVESVNDPAGVVARFQPAHSCVPYLFTVPQSAIDVTTRISRKPIEKGDRVWVSTESYSTKEFKCAGKGPPATVLAIHGNSAWVEWEPGHDGLRPLSTLELAP